MSKFYSPKTGGFYDVAFHGPSRIPSDAIEISDEEWQRLLAEQGRGMEIVPGVGGVPTAVEIDREARRRALNGS